MKFLIVEDSKAVQTIIRRILEKSGYHDVDLRAALSGEEALDILESWVPDMIITDWHMPGISGLEMVQHIRQSGHNSIKIGFVTTETSPQRLQEARNNGAAFIINKPFSHDVLQQAVMAVLNDQSPADSHSPAAKDAVQPERVKIHQMPSIRTILANHLSMAHELEFYAFSSLDKLQLPYAIGLYISPGKRAVDAVCLLDFTASILIGGSVSGLSEAEMKTALTANSLDKDVYESASLFLTDFAPLITEVASNQKPVVMAGSHLVLKSFQKLIDLAQKCSASFGLQITTQNLGTGHIIILLS